MRQIAKIKQRLQEVIIDGKYERDLKKLVSTYEDITKLQNAYFTATVGKYTVPVVLAELQKQSIDITIESLGRAGIDVNVINPVRDILTKNITTGGKIGDFMEEVRAYARHLAHGVSPRATAVMKAQVWKSLYQGLGEAIQVGDEEMQKSFGTEDFREGVAHFMEKRPPKFTGR